MNKLAELMSLCKCGVHLNANEHRNYYQTAEEWFKDHARDECPPEVDPEVKAAMIEQNRVIIANLRWEWCPF